MELTKKRKGLFYVSDALLAVSILFIFMLVAFPIIKVNGEKSELQYDVLTALSSTRISDLNVTLAKNLIANGQINDSSKSVIEALGQLYILNPSKGIALAEEIFKDVDSEYNIGIWVGSNLIYQKIKDKNYSTLPAPKYIDSASQVISGIEEGKNVTGFAARAFLSKTLSTKYYYFGGYVGDGNISVLVDYDGNISSAEIELAINNNFDLYVNGNPEGNYNKSSSEYSPARYQINTTHFNSGENLIEIKNSTNRSSISGGFIKINYKEESESSSSNRYYFPGIKGVINIYDGFYLPGNLNSMDIYLNYTSPQNVSLIIGNETVYQGNSSGEDIINLSDGYLKTQLNYAQISDRNIPIRMGMDEAIESEINRFGNADVVIVTDVSGSMRDKLVGSGDGDSITNCNSPAVWNYGNTSRISLARCININFTSQILSSPGNRVAIVSYEDNSNINLDLTDDSALLNNSIMSLTTGSGTCISCGVNAAYQVLSKSNSSRNKFIVVMTDGQANFRSTYTCTANYMNDLLYKYNINSIDYFNGTGIFVGYNGFFVNGSYNYYGNLIWNNISGFSTGIDLYDVSLHNQTSAFVVAEAGRVYTLNGATWTSGDINAGSALNLYGIDINSSTYALAVGEDGYVHTWNGATWSPGVDINTALGNSDDIRAVSIVSPTLAFAVGERYRIYTWNGATWSSNGRSTSGKNYTDIDSYGTSLAFAVGTGGNISKWDGATWTSGTYGGEHFYGVDIYDSNLAFAVGTSGKIYSWNSGTSSWSEVYDAGSMTLRSVKIVNSTLAFAVGDWQANISVWNGATWSVASINNLDHLFNKVGSCDWDNDNNNFGCNDPFTGDGSAVLANLSSFRAKNNWNITVHSVGFSIEKCTLGNTTVKAMADSGKGNWTSSSNATLLSKFFEDVANKIREVSYDEQRSNVLGDLFSTIYPTSYIEFNYDEPSIPSGLRFSIQKKFNNESNESFELLHGDSIIEARVLSYSGPKWTDKVYLNNSLVYNLSYYGQDYNLLGDPFNIYLPKNRLNIPGRNIVNLTLFPSDFKGSLNDSIIYTVIRNITAYSDIKSAANGCNWSIKTETNGVISVLVPSTYTGNRKCYFNSTSTPNYFDGTENDVYVLATYSLLRQLDANTNNETDVNLEKDFFEIDTSTVTGIPFEWRTTVSVRVWK